MPSRFTALRITALLALIGAAGAPSPAGAVSTGRLPDWVCAQPDALFVDGFEAAGARYREPSGGSGGGSGDATLTVTVVGLGTRTVYVHAPPDLAPAHPMPLVLALHGQAGSPSAADTAARAVRTSWSALADAQRFVVVVPVASGGAGGWIAPPLPPATGVSDYDVMAAAIAAAEARWNVDRSRRIGWGFSAGGHVMHDIMYTPYVAPALSIDTFAAYGVNAGVLQGLACNGLSGAQCSALIAAAPRRIPLDIRVGDTDSLRPYALDDRSRFLAQGWTSGLTLYYAEFSGGHTYAPAQLAGIWADLCPFQRLP